MKSLFSNITKDKNKRLILWTLSDKRAYTAVELSDYAEISKEEGQRAIDEMLKAELLIEENHRHHYYRIKNAEIAEDAEAFLTSQMQGKRKRYSTQDKLSALKYCRSCHNHLAGRVGVALTQKMQEKNMLIRIGKNDEYIFQLTPKGESYFKDFGSDLDKLRNNNGIFVKACLDFSERIHHLGGRLGVAFLDRMKEKAWVERLPNARAHFFTDKGKRKLKEDFQLDLETLQ